MGTLIICRCASTAGSPRRPPAPYVFNEKYGLAAFHVPRASSSVRIYICICIYTRIRDVYAYARAIYDSKMLHTMYGNGDFQYSDLRCRKIINSPHGRVGLPAVSSFLFRCLRYFAPFLYFFFFFFSSRLFYSRISVYSLLAVMTVAVICVDASVDHSS